MTAFALTKTKFSKIRDIIKSAIVDTELQNKIIQEVVEATGYPGDNAVWDYSKRDKEKMRIHSLKYQKNNPEKIKQIQAKYRSRNPEKIKQMQADYYQKRKEAKLKMKQEAEQIQNEKQNNTHIL